MTLLSTIPGLLVREPDSERELLRARQLHADCYVAAGYLEEHELVEGLVDDAWVPYSSYVIALDTEADEIVGTARIIRPSVRGFPAFEHFTPSKEALEIFASLDPNRCCEISALATARSGMQNMAISAAIYGYTWQQAVLGRRAYVFGVMDDRLIRIMRRWLQFPFEPIGEPRYWMGARTTPVAAYVPRAIHQFATENPDALAFFSGEIEFSALDRISVELRDEVPEHRSRVIDLTTSQTSVT